MTLFPQVAAVGRQAELISAGEHISEKERKFGLELVSQDAGAKQHLESNRDSESRF